MEIGQTLDRFIIDQIVRWPNKTMGITGRDPEVLVYAQEGTAQFKLDDELENGGVFRLTAWLPIEQ